MARIDYACGHSGRAQWQGQDCPDCYRAAQLAAAKAKGDEAVAKIAASGEQLPALVGSEKQIAWAMQIRAQMISGPAAWAIKIKLASADPKVQATYQSAHWWIEHRGRIDEDWIALAIPADWRAIEAMGFGCPAMVAAQKILRHGTPGYTSIKGPAELVAALTGLAAMPVQAQRPGLDDRKNFGEQHKDIYNWLVCSWAQAGLIEYLSRKVAEHADTVSATAAAEGTIDAAAKVQAAREEIAKAEALERDARGKQARATHIIEQSRAVIDEAACAIGAKAMLDNVIYTAREIYDDGARIKASPDNGDAWHEFSRPSWIAMYQAYIAGVIYHA